MYSSSLIGELGASAESSWAARPVQPSIGQFKGQNPRWQVRLDSKVYGSALLIMFPRYLDYMAHV